jgi:hypothetical protein
MRAMNPLVWLTQRFPRAFGLEWVETEEPFPTDDPRTWELRKIRLLSGGFLFIDEESKA